MFPLHQDSEMVLGAGEVSPTLHSYGSSLSILLQLHFKQSSTFRLGLTHWLIEARGMYLHFAVLSGQPSTSASISCDNHVLSVKEGVLLLLSLLLPGNAEQYNVSQLLYNSSVDINLDFLA